ncbi:DUF397 domain-containing protein [Kitasatospora sp. NPDC089913]|uniref:DUF397 domain-containing protein n=1 Tax=Streptomycetaceae TaxID=2062 RepID=UPI00087B8FDB|nr:DUF397 domain-containing protein [Streptomyces sp. TLI_053]SDS94238.1 protein of unknown function [Streptomyces sp. TLI_053]
MTHYSVASALPVEWRKASASNPNENCVEFGRFNTSVAVRDSKDPHGPALSFPADSWLAFVAGLRVGDFTARR